MAKILIPESLGKQIRAGARALTQEGDTCDLAWEKFSAKSRYFRSYYKIASSLHDDAGYVRDIVRLWKTHDYDLIMPFGNTSCFAVSKHGEYLVKNGVNHMAPDFETFKTAHDKFKMTEFCEKNGIGVPRVFSTYDSNDVREIANHVQYPVVIKAKSGVGVFTGLRYANNKNELIQGYEDISAQTADTGAFNYDQPLIQEFIPGIIHDVCSLTARGAVVALLTQIRQIMYPIYGGVGAVNLTTDNPELGNVARHLLESLSWHGPAQIEFKYDSRDKKYKLIELNPKLWGTLDLSIRAGINFPGLIRDYLLGKRITPQFSYKKDIRYVFLLPLAVDAYVSFFKEFGLGKRIKLNAKPVETYYGIEPIDLVFEIANLYSTLKSLISRKTWAPPNANLDKELVLSGLDIEIF